MNDLLKKIWEICPGKRERSDATLCRALSAIAMQRLLVSPELKVYTISDREALSELVTELRLDSTLAGNLRQLLKGTRRLGLAARRARWPGTGSAWNRCAG